MKRKLKRWLAFGLAAALVLSAVRGQYQVVSAEEAAETGQGSEDGDVSENTLAEEGQLSDNVQSDEKKQDEENTQNAENLQDAENQQDSGEGEEIKQEESGDVSPVKTPAVPTASDTSKEEDKQDGLAGSEGDEMPSDETAVLEENDLLKTDGSAEDDADAADGMSDMPEEEAGEPAAQAGEIASGTDRNINWRIDADGKLTVNGTGDFTSTSREKPWDQFKEQIISVEVNVSGITDTSWMFSGCENLENINFGGFNTSNVTHMDGMFDGCNSLTTLDLSSFNTSNVTDMHQMFVDCNNLATLNLSSFDTSNVTDMMGMFCNCGSLTTLDLSNFDTSNATNMNMMFSGCSNIVTLDLSSFDTSNVTSMGYMFQYCENLITLDLSGFDTSNVTGMDCMFTDCYNLTTLDLSSFDTSNVANMSEMFANCCNLITLDVSSFDTLNVTNMSMMFAECGKLTTLDVSGFATNNVTDMGHMFAGCSSLSTLDVSSFDTSEVTDMGCMFGGCSNLLTLDVSSFDTSKVTEMWSMFANCSNVAILDVSSFDTSKVEAMDRMFRGCNTLTTLDVSNFNTSNVIDMGSMFADCSNITTLDLSNFDTSNVTNMRMDIHMMFSGCDNLTVIHTPYNIRESIALPTVSGAIWLIPDGSEVTELPQNLSHSVTITRRRNPKIITTTHDLNMEDVVRVKYVPYSYTVETNNWESDNIVTYSLVGGELAEGLMLYPATGEIYGIPLEAGEFPIRVKAEFSNPEYLPSYADLTLTVLDNTDGNVFVASDPGYEVEQYLGTQVSGADGIYYAVRERGDQLFVSAGANGEFIALWLNGAKLTEGEDYTRESGSTRITVRSQTLENKTNKEGTNTIAAEFRVGGNLSNALKRTAQNFRIDFQSQGGGSGSGSHSGRGGSSEEGVVSVSSATAVVRLVDTAGRPLTGAVLELHSTPQTAQTDRKGTAVFGGVPAGLHTLYVKDGAGNVLASRGFELLFGEKASINADQVTVRAGAAFTLQVQMSGNELAFLSVQEGDVYQVVSVSTADTMYPELWLALLLVSCGLSFGLYTGYRKRKTY